MRVALFVTCSNDTMFPDTGRAAVALLERLGVEVDLPAALARVRPDRPLTRVSGPSATSDIELDRVEGVHGPRTLHVLVIEEERS